MRPINGQLDHSELCTDTSNLFILEKNSNATREIKRKTRKKLIETAKKKTTAMLVLPGDCDVPNFKRNSQQTANIPSKTTTGRSILNL